MNYFFNFEKVKYVRGPRPDGCILCLLRDKSSEVVDLTVWADDLFSACVNLYPYNPGHVMVFPNRHITDVREFISEEDKRISDVIRGMLEVLDETQSPSGYNIGYNMGSSAGASIDHLHLHIIPRYPREVGIADLVAGKRVLIEDPRVTQKRLIEAIDRRMNSKTWPPAQ